MLYKQLDSIPLKISGVGLGTGDRFWDATVTREAKIRILQNGIEHGLNFFDTAEGYGDGISEEIVGDAIKQNRHKVIVATKFSPEHSHSNDVVKAAERSLKRLKTEIIDLYQVHWRNPQVPLEETILAMKNLITQGKVRCVGVCNFSLEEFEDAQRYLGKERIASIQTEYNLFERTIEDNGLMDYCKRQGVTVIAYSPLDQGRFSQIDEKQSNVLNTIARKHSKTVPQVVLRWLVHQPPVVALTRTVSSEHLTENAHAMDFDLSEKEVQEIDRAFSFKVVSIPTDKINVVDGGEWNHQVYKTLNEALENKYGFVPSPTDLAEEIKKGKFLKPVRVVRLTHTSEDYKLIGGRIRYWAWVIAKGQKSSIPAYVRELPNETKEGKDENDEK